jgi:hypothetical protein
VCKIILAAVVLAIGPMLFAQQALNNEAIIKLVKAGLSDDLIVSAINGSAASYDTTADGIIVLKTAGASDKVVEAIVVKAAASAPPAQSAMTSPVPAPQAEAPQPADATQSEQATQSVWTCLLNKADYKIVFGDDAVTVTPLAGGFSAALKIRTKRKNKQRIQGLWTVPGKAGYIEFIKWSDTQIDAFLLEATGDGANCDTRLQAVSQALSRGSNLSLPYCQGYRFSFIKKLSPASPTAPSITRQDILAAQKEVASPVNTLSTPFAAI